MLPLLPRLRHPELKVSTPAHAKHLGWYLEFKFRAAPAFQGLDMVDMVARRQNLVDMVVHVKEACPVRLAALR